MIYIADSTIAGRVFRKIFKNLNWCVAIVISFSVIYVLDANRRNHGLSALIFFSALDCLVLIIVFKYFNEIFKIESNMICRLEVSDDEVILETFNVSMFFGMYKSNSFQVTMNRNNVLLELQPNAVLSNEASKGTIYKVICDSEEYWICEKFFDQFDSIKRELTN